MALPLPRIIGMAAGLLILGLGVFVLRAKPWSPLHRLFFAFAMADGASTFAFDLALSPVPEFVRLHAFLLYFYAFIGLVGFLVLFGMVFPRPLLRGAPQRALVAVTIGATAVALLAHLFSYQTFWRPARTDGALGFELEAGGRVLYAAFVLATAFIILRMTWLLRREPSASHRRQGALVLGGLALGFAPGAASVILLGLQAPGPTFTSSRLDVLLVYWAAVLTLVGVLAAGVLLLRERRDDRRRDRNILLSCLAGVLVLSALGSIPGASLTPELVELLGLLVYPIFLAYAIARYEILDIDAHLRRAATLSLVGAAFTALFVAIEALIETAIQGFVTTRATSGLLSTLIAAGIAALVTIPLASGARRLAARIAPALSHGPIEARRREVYRHALEGAAADGTVEPHELRVLASLRESLEISDAEHETMLRAIVERGRGAAGQA